MSHAITSVANTHKQANRRLAGGFVLVVFASLAFAYAQPPLYKAFCEWTGLYDIARADKSSASHTASRPIRIEFDANTHDSGVRFKPQQAFLASNTGDIINITYRIENTRDTAVIGQAVPSYGPKESGQFVKKLDCFCFKQQTFAPHEVRELPVVFFLDKEIPQGIDTVTLSYTFFEVPAGSQPSAASAPTGSKS